MNVSTNPSGNQSTSIPTSNSTSASTSASNNKWPQIDAYLSQLRACLSSMPVNDREEIVREISVHIRECALEPNSRIEEILQRLGSAETLASQYGYELLIRRASRSFSPVLILRAARVLAKRGLQGMLLFMGTLLGYGSAAALILTAILKPILPRNIGLWMGPSTFDFGYHTPRLNDPIRELLGNWYIPVALCTAYLLVWVTTYGIRRYLRRSKQRAPLFASSGLAQTLVLQ